MQHQDQVDEHSDLNRVWLLKPAALSFFADMICYITVWSRKCLCISFLWYFKNFDLYSKVKGRLSVAES